MIFYRVIPDIWWQEGRDEWQATSSPLTILTFCLPWCCEHSQDLVGRVPAVNPGLGNACSHGCSCTSNLCTSSVTRTFCIVQLPWRLLHLSPCLGVHRTEKQAAVRVTEGSSADVWYSTITKHSWWWLVCVCGMAVLSLLVSLWMPVTQELMQKPCHVCYIRI